MYKPITQQFTVSFTYPTVFTEGVFQVENSIFREILNQDGRNQARKILFVIDEGVSQHHPELDRQIQNYCIANADILQLKSILTVPGGEIVKNQPQLVEQILEAIDKYGICRHSYVVVIGGGAVLDMVGYAAAIAHRSVRLIRMPTTVLAQNDSGVGVKNGINYFGKKNFLGTFKPPFAVINDFQFLLTLSERDWRSGISEALKVALIKDADFFHQIKENAPKLNARKMGAMQSLIYRCAEMHLAHIAGGDPFELGSSRPLDFGHWAAHKLEQLTDYTLRHGEAVAIGIALDVTYAFLIGMLRQEEWEIILELIQALGFTIFQTELLEKKNNKYLIINGLQEFREHLGGELTIMLLDKIGHGVEVHQIDETKMIEAIQVLKSIHESKLVNEVI
jgi:3-dehydroquinate synthase